MTYCKPLIGLLLTLLLSGCATYAELPGNHIARVITAEERSPFGTNVTFGRLQHCEKRCDDKGVTTYVHCQWASDWVPFSSQGQGGQVVSGALTGLGFGLGSAFSGAGNATGAVTNSITNTTTKSVVNGGYR